MGLLGDFLMGAVTQGGREILNRTLADDERQRRIDDEERLHKRNRSESDADYERRRKAALDDAERLEKTRLRLQAEAADAAERKTLAKARAGAGALTMAAEPGLLQGELDAVQKGQNPFQATVDDESGGHAVPDEKRFMQVMQTYNKALAKTVTGSSSDDIAKSKMLDQQAAELAAGRYQNATRIGRAMKGDGDVSVNAQGTLNHVTGEFTPLDKSATGLTPAQRLTHSQAVITAAGQRLRDLEREASSLRNNIKEHQRNLAGAGAKDRPAIQAQIEAADTELKRLQGDWQAQKRYYDDALAEQAALRGGGAPAARSGGGLLGAAPGAPSSPMEMAAAEAVSSGQPVDFNLGGRKGTLKGGTGAERAAAPSDKDTNNLPEAPRELSQRKVGQIYKTPRGPLMWMGNGWRRV